MAVIPRGTGWLEARDTESGEILPMDWTDLEKLRRWPYHTLMRFILEAYAEKIRWFRLFRNEAIGEKYMFPCRYVVDSDGCTILARMYRPLWLPQGHATTYGAEFVEVDPVTLEGDPYFWNDSITEDIPTGPTAQGVIRYAVTEAEPEFPEVFSENVKYYMMAGDGCWSSAGVWGNWQVELNGLSYFGMPFPTYDPAEAPVTTNRWYGEGWAFAIYPKTNQWTLCYRTYGDHEDRIRWEDYTGTSRWPVTVVEGDPKVDARIDNFDGDGQAARTVFVTKEFYDWQEIAQDGTHYDDQPLLWNDDLQAPTPMVNRKGYGFARWINMAMEAVFAMYLHPSMIVPGTIDNTAGTIPESGYVFERYHYAHSPTVWDWLQEQDETELFQWELIARPDAENEEDTVGYPGVITARWLSSMKIALDQCTIVGSNKDFPGMGTSGGAYSENGYANACQEVSQGEAGEEVEITGYMGGIQGEGILNWIDWEDPNYPSYESLTRVYQSSPFSWGDSGGLGRLWMAGLTVEYTIRTHAAQIRPYESWWILPPAVDIPYADVDGRIRGVEEGMLLSLGVLDRKWCYLAPAAYDSEPGNGYHDPWNYTDPISGWSTGTGEIRIFRFADCLIYHG